MSSGPSAELHRAAFRVSPVPSVLLDPTLRVIDVNAAFLAASGTTSDDTLGRNLLDVVRAHAAVDTSGSATPWAVVGASVERAQQTGGSDSVDGLEWWSRDPGGEPDPRIWALTTTAVTDAVGGGPTAMLAQVDDLTALVTERDAANASVRTEHERLLAEVEAAQASLIVRAEQLQSLNEQLQQAGHRDRSVAQVLQNSLLTRLPATSHLQLAARYLTATGTDQVGGDWYDAYVSPNDDVTLTIGDVMGHDMVAAGLMGQMRNLLRALVVDRCESPAQLLSRLDHALQRLHLDTLATAALLAARPHEAGGWTLSWSNAGHPAPLLISPDGAVDLLDGARSTLLGVRPETARADMVRHIAPGSVLLLYTDGLIETREHDIDNGKARLASSVARHHRLAPGQFLDAVLAEMVGGQPEDDVAVLAVRFSEVSGAGVEAGPAR